MLLPRRLQVSQMLLALPLACLLAAGATGLPAAAAASEAAVGAEASEAAAVGATVYAFAGVEAAIPDNLDVANLGSMALASNGDASLVVSLIGPSSTSDAPVDEDGWQAYFTPFAQASLDEIASSGQPASLSDGGVVSLRDGALAYLLEVSFTASDGTPMRAAQYYVPLGDGTFTMAQVASDASDESASKQARAVAASVQLQTEDAVELSGPSGQAEGSLLSQTVEEGGVSFGLPDGFVASGRHDGQASGGVADAGVSASGSGTPSWHSPDGTLVIGVLPRLIENLSAIGSDSFDVIAEGVAQSLSGKLEARASLESGTAVYVFTFSSDGEEFIGTLALVPLDDDSVTGLLALTPLSSAAENDAAVAAVFRSVRAL